jgi:hypothetical protein
MLQQLGYKHIFFSYEAAAAKRLQAKNECCTSPS